jgi:hypothetical protein
MKQNVSLIVVLIVINSFAYSQPAPSGNGSNGKFTFSSINTVGLMSGSNGEALSLHTINGVAKDKWFAGAGIGFDYYACRTVPLFIDVTREIFSKKNTPFIYADAGLNIPWATTDQKLSRGGSTTFKKGIFYDAGIGWKLKSKNERGFLFSAGYSVKQVKEEVDQSWWGIWPPGPSQEQPRKEYFDSRYKRIIIKVGVQL